MSFWIIQLKANYEILCPVTQSWKAIRNFNVKELKGIIILIGQMVETIFSNIVIGVNKYIHLLSTYMKCTYTYCICIFTSMNIIFYLLVYVTYQFWERYPITINQNSRLKSQ